jgi:SAM-dependent methyltransferase
MRRSVDDLYSFYATPLGRAARDMVARKIAEAWDGVRTLDVLGVGYPTPYLEVFNPDARRTVAAMPQGQGAAVWGPGGRNLVCLAGEGELPFPNALFDRVLLIHALEESDDPEGLMIEARRVLAPSGRLIVVAASRRGLWSRAENTPFGYGRPFSRSQLEAVVNIAGLEPTAWSRALYMPPHAAFAPYAEVIEQVGSRLLAPFSGVIMLEAVKQTFAVRPKGARAPAFATPAFGPVPVGAAFKPWPSRGEARRLDLGQAAAERGV